MGISYTSKGFYDEADKALTKAFELAPADVMANYHIAALRAAQGRDVECFEALERAAQVERERVRQWVDSDRYFDAVRGHHQLQILLFDTSTAS